MSYYIPKTNIIDSINQQLINQIPLTNQPIISPISIFFTMGLINIGAKNKTKFELQRALNISINDEQLLDSLKIINNLCNQKNNLITLSNSNVLLFKSGLVINPTYIDQFERLLNGKLISFQSPSQAVTKTNQWITQKTNGIIQSFLSQGNVDNNTQMILVNAIYFKANWKYQFKNYNNTKEIFYGLTKTQYVDMMHITKNYLYTEDMFLQYIVIPYADPNYALIVGLPKFLDTDQMVLGLKQILNDPNLVMEKNYRSVEVCLSLPKFEHRKKIQLIDMFKKLGVTELFTKNADLSTISSQKGIYIDQIIHEVVIKIDEQGSEATAVTLASATFGISLSKPTIDFNVNHSFYYAIVNVPSKVILFNGVYG